MTILGGVLAFLVPFSWLLGRVYMEGYANAMGVSHRMLQLSQWEYVAMGWWRVGLTVFQVGSILFLCILVISYACVFLVHMKFMLNTSAPLNPLIGIGLLSLLFLFFYATGSRNPYLFTMILCVFVFTVIVSFNQNRDQFWEQISKKEPVNLQKIERIRFWRILLTILYGPSVLMMSSIFLIFTVNFAGTEANEQGIQDGMTDVIENTQSMHLIVTEPLYLVVSQNKSSLFVYEGLRWLAYHDNHYFLFTDVNSECRPEQVYIVKESVIQNIQVTNVAPLSPDCVPATPTVIPTTVPSETPPPQAPPKLIP